MAVLVPFLLVVRMFLGYTDLIREPYDTYVTSDIVEVMEMK